MTSTMRQLKECKALPVYFLMAMITPVPVYIVGVYWNIAHDDIQYISLVDIHYYVHYTFTCQPLYLQYGHKQGQVEDIRNVSIAIVIGVLSICGSWYKISTPQDPPERLYD